MKPGNPTTIRYIVFREKDTWYGVALELNIVVDGDTADQVVASLFDAITGYHDVQDDPQFEGKTFHEPAVDPEYEALWKQSQQAKGSIKSPLQVYTSGTRQLV